MSGPEVRIYHLHGRSSSKKTTTFFIVTMTSW
jgi:hypothetical protein